MPVGAPAGIQTLHLPNKPYLFGETVTLYKQGRNKELEE